MSVFLPKRDTGGALLSFYFLVNIITSRTREGELTCHTASGTVVPVARSHSSGAEDDLLHRLELLVVHFSISIKVKHHERYLKVPRWCWEIEKYMVRYYVW